MTGQSPHPVASEGAADSSEVVSPNLFQHRRFWLRLAAYRPLLVVGGFWVVLLAIALVAYGRLTDTGTQQRAEPRNPYPHEQAQLDQEALQAPPAPISSDIAEDLETESASDANDATEVSSSDSASVPVWSLGLLVALCAGGCLALSQQLKPGRAAPRHKPAPLKMSGPRAISPESAKAVQKAAPKRMQPYRPGAGFAPAAQQETPTVPVAVVPEERANPLDWPKDSLINTMDVRQRRDVSSWLSS